MRFFSLRRRRDSHSKILHGLLALIAISATPAVAAATQAPAQSILFVGNSFTYGAHSPVWRYHADLVHDLNGDGVGGVPALFKLFTREAGLDYDVSLETVGGKTLKFHYTQKRAQIDRSWDHVVMQEYSTLSPDKPGDPATFKQYAGNLATMFQHQNPSVDIRLMATWSRPDLTYQPGGHWYGKPIDAMGDDLQKAYADVVAGNPSINGVIAVGSAFNRAIATGVADGNPYDGIRFNQVDLWAYDHYHASTYGYYLEALMDFGSITGKDPRSLGKHEKAAGELGLSPEQAEALQQVAYRQLHRVP
ncbi:MAG: PEP-CTERM sorting domain-containing protein [Pseudomonadota bacterium]|nr:PEP-CTERM sorting domain-containing protein [Pseudomonadota bacterium]